MAFMLASCTYGFGQHIANLTKENKAKTLKVRDLQILLPFKSPPSICVHIRN